MLPDPLWLLTLSPADLKVAVDVLNRFAKLDAERREVDMHNLATLIGNRLAEVLAPALRR